MVRDIKRLLFYLSFAGLALAGNPLFAQFKFGDNLGSHKATKDLDLQSHNINAANLVAAKGAVIGTATTLSNASVALQVDGTNKAILVPRVTDLLNATTPSIPVANAINGMIVYDIATNKFYHRQNNVWVAYADVNNYVDRFLPQIIRGKKTFKSDSGFVALGTFGAGVIPASGAGARMMYDSGKAAFRVGAVDGAQWDDANVGAYSAAFGSNNIASNSYSFAAGFGSTAAGLASFAIGNGAQAFGAGMCGALGWNVIANGPDCYVFGSNCHSDTFTGVMLFGDNSTNAFLKPSANNQLSMRFAGGYRLFSSSDPASNIGVQLTSNGNAWSTLSDKRKKTNFETADAESFLVKIDTMQLGSWNYKAQDAKGFRHYGPMAQDFYSAFGKDSYGTIGCDTLINSADFDGVNMIAIKGLVRRTKDLMQRNDDLKMKVSALKSVTQEAIAALMEKIEALDRRLIEEENHN